MLEEGLGRLGVVRYPGAKTAATAVGWTVACLAAVVPSAEG